MVRSRDTFFANLQIETVANIRRSAFPDLSRLIFYRESASKAYRQFPFALSMVLAEMPYSILCAVGFFLPIYYMYATKSPSSLPSN